MAENKKKREEEAARRKAEEGGEYRAFGLALLKKTLDSQVLKWGCKIVALSRLVALTVSLTQKVSPFQTDGTGRTSTAAMRTPASGRTARTTTRT